MTSIEIIYSLHEDGWTETLCGLNFLVKEIENLEQSGDSNTIYLTRLCIISSSYLAEQVFNSAVTKYIETALNNLGNSEAEVSKKQFYEDWRENNTLRKIGISRAIREWPQELTGKKLFLGSGVMQALKVLTDKRNDIVHKLDDLTQYIQPSDIAKSAIFTAVEACKIIEDHFFPGQNFTYDKWLKTYPVENAPLFRNE